MGELVVCSKCQREFKGYVPKGGDGSLLYVYYHHRSYFEFVSMYTQFRRSVKCEGSNKAALEVGINNG